MKAVRSVVAAGALAFLLSGALIAAGAGPTRAQTASPPEAAPAPAPAQRQYAPPPPPKIEPGVGRVTGFPIPRYVSLKSDKTNVRRGPSRAYRIDWEFLRRGMPVRVVDEHGLWLRIQDHDDVTGWVHRILVSGVRTALVTAPEGATLRDAPRADASARARLEAGVVARIDECRPAWCRLRVEGHDGWADKAALWGVDAGETFE